MCFFPWQTNKFAICLVGSLQFTQSLTRGTENGVVRMNLSTSNNRYLLPVAPGTAVASITMLSVAGLVGFLANAYVCVLLRKRSDLRKVPHYLFGSLVVNGIFSSLLNLLVLTVIHLWDIQVSAKPVCYVLVPSGFACNILNTVTLSLMVIDRQDCVLRPFKRRMGRGNIPKVIVLSWIGTLVLAFPIIFKSVRQQLEGCDVIPKIRGVGDPVLVYIGILSNSFNIASVLIIVVTALRIIKRLRSSPLPESNSLHSRQENKLLWLTYKMCGVFIVCKLPIFVYFPFAIFSLENNDYTLANIQIIALAMSNFHYVVNPFLYYNMLRPADRGARDIRIN